jgi:hypothetical protein
MTTPKHQDGQMDVFECIEVAEKNLDGKTRTKETGMPATAPNRTLATKDATSAAVVFVYDGRHGYWKTIIVRRSMVLHDRHANERAARSYIGLEGGSPDPEYRPDMDGRGNGYEKAI